MLARLSAWRLEVGVLAAAAASRVDKGVWKSTSKSRARAAALAVGKAWGRVCFLLDAARGWCGGPRARVAVYLAEEGQ